MKCFLESHYRQKGYDPLYNIRHSHKDTFEILQIWNDSGQVLIKNKLYPFVNGGLYFINSIDTHCTIPKVPEEYIRSKLILSSEFLEQIMYLADNEKMIQSLFLENGGAFFALDKASSMEFDHILKVIAKLDDLDSTHRLLKISYILSVFAKINTINSKKIKSDRSKIIEIMNYIDNNLSEHISIDGVSQNVRMSKYYLCHIFKEETGMTVMQYVQSRRLSSAKKKLLYTDLSISEISQITGFSSFSFFTQFFRKAQGMNPSEYRKLYKL